MLARLSLSFKQLTALSLQFCRAQLQSAVLAVEFATERDQVCYLFLQRLNQVFRHGLFTALGECQHYNVTCFVGSMIGGPIAL